MPDDEYNRDTHYRPKDAKINDHNFEEKEGHN